MSQQRAGVLDKAHAGQVTFADQQNCSGKELSGCVALGTLCDARMIEGSAMRMASLLAINEHMATCMFLGTGDGGHIFSQVAVSVQAIQAFAGQSDICDAFSHCPFSA